MQVFSIKFSSDLTVNQVRRCWNPFLLPLCVIKRKHLYCRTVRGYQDVHRGSSRRSRAFCCRSRSAFSVVMLTARPTLWTSLVLRGWQRKLPTAWSLWLKSGGVSLCCTVAEVGLDSGLGVIPLSRWCFRDPHTSSASRWRIKRIKTFGFHQNHCWCCQCSVIKINV